MGKLTMQDVADVAGVSRITVWKVLTRKDGVSEKIRKRVEDAATAIGYGQRGETQPTAKMGKTFSVVVARPESSMFWMQIIHNIAKELTRARTNLLYTYIPSHWSEGYHLPPTVAPGQADGLIVLNIYDRDMLQMLTQVPLPKVFLDTVPDLPPQELKGDIVLVESFFKIRSITRSLAQSGRRRLSFIGDTVYAQTNADRLLGFQTGLREEGIPYDPATSLTGPLGLNSHYQEIKWFLDHLPEWPDAIVCCSDFIANFVLRYLEETGRPVPENFLLTGFDNNKEYAAVADTITTVNVDTASLGKRLASQLLYRCDTPSAPQEIIYQETELLWKAPLAPVQVAQGYPSFLL